LGALVGTPPSEPPPVLCGKMTGRRSRVVHAKPKVMAMSIVSKRAEVMARGSYWDST
jgi:hypothetical protein